MNKKIALVITTVIVITIGLLVNKNQNNVTEPVTTVNNPQENGTGTEKVTTNTVESAPKNTIASPHEMTEAQQMEALANMMQEKMIGRTENPYWQLKLVRDMRDLFKKKYADLWRDKLIQFFHQGFPELAEKLIALLNAVEEYEAWLIASGEGQDYNDPKAWRDAMWDKRIELFGEEALEIWEAALKTEQFEDAINEIDNHEGTFSEKQDLYITSVKELFGENAIGPNAPHKTQMLTNFLDIGNVQSDLKNMDREQQKQTLRSFRQAMGLDQAALNRWETLDEQRAQQRTVGQQYMEQRKALETKYQGDSLNQQINVLRVNLFGESEAKYLANEEASGFFRFEHEQKIGLN